MMTKRSSHMPSSTTSPTTKSAIGECRMRADHSDCGITTLHRITDQASGVSVLVQSTRATGVVRGSVDGKLTLEYYAGAKLPKTGDVLLTSGMGGAYPKGLVVGDVGKVEADAAGMLPHVDVISRVPIATTEEVLVLVGAEPSQVVGGVE